MSTIGFPVDVGVGFDPLRDKSYQSTRLGRDIADFLAWCELGGMSPKTLVNYEPDLARGALMFPDKGIQDITGGDLLQIAKRFPPAEHPIYEPLVDAGFARHEFGVWSTAAQHSVSRERDRRIEVVWASPRAAQPSLFTAGAA